MYIKNIILLLILVSNLSLAETIPALPILPAFPPGTNTDTIVPSLPNSDDINQNTGKIRKLLKNTTVMLESQVKVSVPLEIISDVDIETLVIDNEKLEIPFDIELNKEPDLKDYYRLKFSETKIDIDKDGQIDTVIYHPKFLNTRIVEDNIVSIDGSKISKEGTHNKKIYMTIEVKE